jgi:integrase
LADLEGKGRRIRTVAIPIWVKHGINAWMTAAGIEDGRLLRSVSKSGKINRDTLSDWAVWSIVEQSSKQIGIEHFGAHDLRTCAKLCRKSGGDPGADQIPAGALLDPDDRALSGVGAGPSRSR